MMRRFSRWLLLACVVVLGAGIVNMAPDARVAAQDDAAIAAITSPVEGEQLFGLATIIGSAGHPSAFESYTLEYKDLTDPNAPWMLAQERVRQQVTDGVLGAWNTNVVPDGTYGLRLRVFLQDGQVGAETVVNGLTIVNSAPTPVPTALSGAASQSATITPGGPTPTSPIQQPPSNSPATPDTVAGPDVETDGGTGLTTTTDTRTTTTTRVNVGRVRSAFCSGVYLALAIFIAMLAYVALRGRLRPYTRRLLWQIEDDLDSDR